MSHNIKHCDYPERVDRKKISQEINSYISYETRQEGGSGLLHPIRWIEDCGILTDYDAAEKYISEHDNGWYDALAVRYYVVDERLLSSQKLMQLNKQQAELYKKYTEKNEARYVDSVSTAYIGCKQCGSKLSREYLKKMNSHVNHCPLCNADLRSVTTQNSIAALKKRLDSCREQVNTETKKLEVKMRKKASVRWLVKFEYHT